MKKNVHTKLRINRIRNFLFLVVSLSVFMMSCRQEPSDPAGTDVPMSFAARLHEQYSQSLSPTVTKADEQPAQTGSVTTLNNEKLGIYVVRGALDASNPLLFQGNTYDNIECPIGADGSPMPAQSMYYPTRRDHIDVYSYRPYDQNLANPNFIKWQLPTDQTDETLVKAADFLFSKKQVAPLKDDAAQVPVDLELKHALTLVHVSVTVPKLFLDKEISGVESPLIVNTANIARIAIGDQYAEKYPQAEATDIIPRLVTTNVDTEGNNIYLYEALLVPQAIAQGNQLFRFSVNFKDGSNGIFRYYLNDETYSLKSGYFQTINLVLADYGKLELTNATINDWSNQPVNGNIGGGGVGNTFEMNMIEPLVDYSTTKTITGVRMYISGTPFIFTTRPPVVSGNKLITTVKVSFPSDNNMQPPVYPFLIDKIEFLGATTNVLTAYNVSVEVTAGGNVFIPLYEYSVIAPTTSVNGWGPAVTYNETAYPNVAVSNQYMIYYCNAAATSTNSCKSVTKMILTIAGQDVTIDNFTMNNSANTQFAAISDVAVQMPTTNAPIRYPYTITNVTIFDKTKQLSTKSANIVVWAQGQVGIAIML